MSQPKKKSTLSMIPLKSAQTTQNKFNVKKEIESMEPPPECEFFIKYANIK